MRERVDAVLSADYMDNVRGLSRLLGCQRIMESSGCAGNLWWRFRWPHLLALGVVFQEKRYLADLTMDRSTQVMGDDREWRVTPNRAICGDEAAPRARPTNAFNLPMSIGTTSFMEGSQTH